MRARSALAVLFIAVFIVLFYTMIGWVRIPIPAILPAVPVPPGAALWKGRSLEVMLQGIIILAGVMAILLLLSEKKGVEDD